MSINLFGQWLASVECLAIADRRFCGLLSLMCSLEYRELLYSPKLSTSFSMPRDETTEVEVTY